MQTMVDVKLCSCAPLLLYRVPAAAGGQGAGVGGEGSRALQSRCVSELSPGPGPASVCSATHPLG